MKQYIDFIVVQTNNLDSYGLNPEDIENENGSDTIKSVCDPDTMKKIVSHWRDSGKRVKTVTIIKDNDPNNMWIKAPKSEIEKLGILNKLSETKENNDTLFLYGKDCDLYYQTMRSEKPTEFKNRVFNSKRKSRIFSYKDYEVARSEKVCEDPVAETEPTSNNHALVLAGKMATLVRRLVGGKEFTVGSVLPEASVTQAAEIYKQLKEVVDEYDACIKANTLNS